MAKAKSYLLQVGTVGAAAGFLYLGFENTALQTTRLRVQSSRLPVGFDGFRIAHLSDTHSSSFGKNNRRLSGAAAACAVSPRRTPEDTRRPSAPDGYRRDPGCFPPGRARPPEIMKHACRGLMCAPAAG